MRDDTRTTVFGNCGQGHRRRDGCIINRGDAEGRTTSDALRISHAIGGAIVGNGVTKADTGVVVQSRCVTPGAVAVVNQASTTTTDGNITDRQRVTVNIAGIA